jgi:NAD(P)-dependent dehydrogenase (short-subunit alcohol dehydrogenase family)
MENKKVALITGCSSGFGYYTTLTLARNNHQVFAAVRNLQHDGVRSIKELANKENLDLQIIPIDVTNDTSIKQGINLIKRATKRIDILVNNAGTMHLGPIESFSIEEIQKQFEVNYYGPLRMIKQIAPLMRQQKSGFIINISSINGLVSVPLYGIYSSAKFALETSTEVLRFELAPFGIKVVLVEPGVFYTNIWHNKKHPIQMTEQNSPYQKYIKFFNVLNKWQLAKQNSWIKWLVHPQRVASSIYKITQKESPRLRYIVGYDARFLYLCRRYLPENFWFWIMHKIYNW